MEERRWISVNPLADVHLTFLFLRLWGMTALPPFSLWHLLFPTAFWSPGIFSSHQQQLRPMETSISVAFFFSFFKSVGSRERSTDRNTEIRHDHIWYLCRCWDSLSLSYHLSSIKQLFFFSNDQLASRSSDSQHQIPPVQQETTVGRKNSSVGPNLGQILTPSYKYACRFQKYCNF